MDAIILDGNLEAVGIIEDYKSFIWAERYADTGDCELYVPVTQENLDTLKMNRFIIRTDRDMVCIIRYVELETDVENGDYLIVKGYDVKSFLDQRIVWSIAYISGKIEEAVREIVVQSAISPEDGNRRFERTDGNPLLKLGTLAGFTAESTEQIDHPVIGVKIREYCARYHWGYRFRKDFGRLAFELYKGTDRSGSVFFKPSFENINTTRFIDDESGMGNVALIAGEGSGAERVWNQYGNAVGVDRFEKYIDANSTSSSITWEKLKETYPPVSQGGTGYRSGRTYVVGQLNIEIIDTTQLTWLQDNFPGEIIETDDTAYYRITDAVVASLLSESMQDSDICTLTALIYQLQLISKGAEELSKYGQYISFEGTIIPEGVYDYRQDYYLGDVVSIENDYGIKAKARIVEMVESDDDSNGYSMQPKFEYVSVTGTDGLSQFITTEDMITITTEDGEPLATESDESGGGGGGTPIPPVTVPAEITNEYGEAITTELGEALTTERDETG